MKENGAKKVTPVLRTEDKDMPLLPWVDPENFNPGYMMRNMHLLPKRGDNPNGGILRITGPRKTRFPPPTSTTARSFTSEWRGPACRDRALTGPATRTISCTTDGRLSWTMCRTPSCGKT